MECPESWDEEALRICGVRPDGSWDIGSVSEEGLRRIGEIYSETEDPSMRMALGSAALRCIAARFQGIPSPDQLKRMMAMDAGAACILMAGSVEALMSTAGARLRLDDPDEESRRSLREYAETCLARSDAEEPGMERLTEWVMLFRKVVLMTAERYCRGSTRHRMDDGSGRSLPVAGANICY